MFERQEKLCLNFLGKLQANRQKIFSDIMETNPDLYKALLLPIHSAKREVCLRLYDLSWFQNLWKSVQSLFEKKDLPFFEKQKLVEWYTAFLKSWEFSSFGKTLISDEMRILNYMLSSDEKWEENLNRIQVKFLKMKTKLDKNLENLKKEEE